MSFLPRQSVRRKLTYLGLATWSIFITLLLYGPTLSLPFFFDDLDLLPFAAETPLGNIWQTAGSFPYFRPLQITVWRLVYLLFGEHNAFWLHAINLVLHLANGWMVGYLGGHLFAKKRQNSLTVWHWEVGWISSTLFLVYPFSFQAVPWIGSLAHMLVISLLLGSLICFSKFYITEKKRWAILSLMLTFLAPFTHENGIICFPIIVAYAWTHPRSKPSPIQFRNVILWLLPPLIWFPIWFFAPKTKSSLIINGMEAIMQNASYFMQGVAYPFTWIGGWLRDRWEWNDLVSAVLLSTVAVIFIVLVQLYGKKQKTNPKIPRYLAILAWSKTVQAFPWYWCILTTLPAIFLLSFNYTISAPRLLMVPSVGISLIWGNIFALLLRSFHPKVIQNSRRLHLRYIIPTLAGILLLLVTLGQNYQFVTRFVQYHTMLGEVSIQAADYILDANKNGRSAILINFPNEVRGHTTIYPLGHEGVLFLVDYLIVQDLIDLQTGQHSDFDLIRYNDLLSNDGAYVYGVLGKGQSWASLVAEKNDPIIYLTTFSNDKITLEPVGQLQAMTLDEQPMAIFSEASGQDIQLVSGCVTPQAGNLQITTLWQITDPPTFNTTIFVHVLDAQGQLIAQKDGFVFGGTYPMGEWKRRTVLQDIRTIPFSDDSFSVHVGLYDWVVGERLTAVFKNNSSFPEDSYLLPRCTQ